MRVTMIGRWLRRARLRRLLCRFRSSGDVHRQGCGRVAALNRGEIPIFEPGLAELVGANIRAGPARIRHAKRSASAEADAVFIAVGTPSRRGDGHADLSFVYDAVREIAPLLSGAAVVVTKSTVPVGTGDEIERILREQRPDADIAGRLQSGIPARGRRHPGFQASRPHRGRHRR